jgi:hypothetical protein
MFIKKQISDEDRKSLNSLLPMFNWNDLHDFRRRNTQTIFPYSKEDFLLACAEQRKFVEEEGYDPFRIMERSKRIFHFITNEDEYIEEQYYFLRKILSSGNFFKGISGFSDLYSACPQYLRIFSVVSHTAKLFYSWYHVYTAPDLSYINTWNSRFGNVKKPLEFDSWKVRDKLYFWRDFYEKEAVKSAKEQYGVDILEEYAKDFTPYVEDENKELPEWLRRRSVSYRYSWQEHFSPYALLQISSFFNDHAEGDIEAVTLHVVDDGSRRQPLPKNER